MTQVEDKGQLVETKTGEVIEDVNQVRDLMVPDRDVFIGQLLSNTQRPLHMQKLDELGLDPGKKAVLLSRYVGQVPQKLEHHLNKVVTIVGAIVYWSGPFMSTKTNRMEDGYYKNVMKLKETYEVEVRTSDRIVKRQRNIIIATSGKRVAQVLMPLIEAYGWFDWPEGVGVPVILTKDEDNNHLIEVVEPEEQES